MVKSLEVAATEIEAALSPLPVGHSVKVAENSDAIIIGSKDLAFAITAKSIADGNYLEKAKIAFPQLLSAIKLGKQNEHQ